MPNRANQREKIDAVLSKLESLKTIPNNSSVLASMLQQLASLSSLLDQMLMGEEVYVFDACLNQFVLKQERFKHYLKLPFDEQIIYCQIRALYCQALHCVAILYEQAGQYDKALEYHLMTMSHGRLDLLFTGIVIETVSTKTYDISIDNPLHEALSILLGIGRPSHVPTAMTHFYFCTEDKNYSSYAHLFLGLIQYYGLNGQRNIKQATLHFQLASDSGLALASQYLGLCQITEGKFYCGKTHLKEGAKAGLPLAQARLGELYKQGRGMFMKHTHKGEQLLLLAQTQQEAKTILSD